MNDLSPIDGGVLIIIIMFAVLFMLQINFKNKKK